MDRPSPEQLAIYRAMAPAERLRQAEALWWTARRLRAAQERALHPDWTEEQIEARVRWCSCGPRRASSEATSSTTSNSRSS